MRKEKRSFPRILWRTLPDLMSNHILYSCDVSGQPQRLRHWLLQPVLAQLPFLSLASWDVHLLQLRQCHCFVIVKECELKMLSHISESSITKLVLNAGISPIRPTKSNYHGFGLVFHNYGALPVLWRPTMLSQNWTVLKSPNIPNFVMFCGIQRSRISATYP